MVRELLRHGHRAVHQHAREPGEKALAAGTAPLIGPEQSLEVELTTVFIPGQATTHSISGDGRVETTSAI